MCNNYYCNIHLLITASVQRYIQVLSQANQNTRHVEMHSKDDNQYQQEDDDGYRRRASAMTNKDYVCDTLHIHVKFSSLSS